MNRRGLIIGGLGAAAAGAGALATVRSMGSDKAYDQAMAALRKPLAPACDVREAIRYGTLAASGHNTQPWRFILESGAIRIAPDLTRRTPAVDPDDHHLYVSLGCAAENLALAAKALGAVGEPQFASAGEGQIVYTYRQAPARPSTLCDAIPHRQSTRADFDGRLVPVADLTQLQRAAVEPGVDLVLITERRKMDQVRDLVIAGNDMQMSDAAFMAEFKSWMRFNPREALKHGDGLFSASSGAPPLPDFLARPAFDLVFTPKAENAKYARQMASSAGLAAFFGAGSTPADWVAVGRSGQRFALQATALGMKLSFVNQPVEAPALRGELAALAGMAGRRPDLLMRFGYGPMLPMSPRRAVDAVIEA
jgi:nitroreductase